MALDGTYKVAVDIGKRHEEGEIDIATKGSGINLILRSSVIGTVKAAGEIGPDNSFTASGNVRVLFKRITYSITGRVRGSKLIAICETNLGTVDVTGSRIK